MHPWDSGPRKHKGKDERGGGNKGTKQKVPKGLTKGKINVKKKKKGVKRGRRVQGEKGRARHQNEKERAIGWKEYD